MKNSFCYSKKDAEFLSGIGSIQPDLNWAIRERRLSDTQEKIRDRLDTLIQKNKLPGQIAVFRGVSIDTFESMDTFKIKNDEEEPETLFIERGYVSTCRSLRALNRMARYPVIMIISVVEGTPAIFMEEFSESPWQQEVLLQRNCVLRVMLDMEDSGCRYIWCEALYLTG